MRKYSAYGLLLESELQLFALPEIESERRVDANIIRGAIEAPDKQYLRIGPFCNVGHEYCYLKIPGVMKMRVQSGREICVDPMPGLDKETVSAFVLSTAIPTLLLQRGLLVLRGAALQSDKDTILLCGRSVSWTNTLSVFLKEKKYKLVSGHYIVFNRLGSIETGIPQVYLSESSLKLLRLEREDLREIRPGVSHFIFPYSTTAFKPEVSPRKMIILSLHNRSNSKAKKIKGFEKFNALKLQVFNNQIFNAMALEPQFLSLISSVADKMFITEIHHNVSITPKVIVNEIVELK